MPRYATETTVPVERSRAEIEEILKKYGADEFHSGWKSDQAMVMFRVKQLLIRFVVPFPDKNDKRFTHKLVRGFQRMRTDAQKANAYEQELRQRWRALTLVVKAKLEAVECRISTIEQEFMAFVVMPNDQTLGDWLMHEALPQIRSGVVPQLGYKGTNNHDVTDAEFEVKK